MGFEQGTFWFLLQCLNPLGHFLCFCSLLMLHRQLFSILLTLDLSRILNILAVINLSFGNILFHENSKCSASCKRTVQNLCCIAKCWFYSEFCPVLFYSGFYVWHFCQFSLVQFGSVVCPLNLALFDAVWPCGIFHFDVKTYLSTLNVLVCLSVIYLPPLIHWLLIYSLC